MRTVKKGNPPVNGLCSLGQTRLHCGHVHRSTSRCWQKSGSADGAPPASPAPAAAAAAPLDAASTAGLRRERGVTSSPRCALPKRKPIRSVMELSSFNNNNNNSFTAAY